MQNSAEELLLFISDGWNSVVSKIKVRVCGFPTADGEVAYILKVNELAESIHEPKKLAEKVRKWRRQKLATRIRKS